MSYAQYATHLGGNLANLAWEDLNPHELVLASCGSPVKAQALLGLAAQQISAAYELHDPPEVQAFEEAARALAAVAGKGARLMIAHSLGRQR